MVKRPRPHNVVENEFTIGGLEKRASLYIFAGRGPRPTGGAQAPGLLLGEAISVSRYKGSDKMIR